MFIYIYTVIYCHITKKTLFPGEISKQLPKGSQLCLGRSRALRLGHKATVPEGRSGYV